LGNIILTNQLALSAEIKGPLSRDLFLTILTLLFRNAIASALCSCNCILHVPCSPSICVVKYTQKSRSIKDANKL